MSDAARWRRVAWLFLWTTLAFWAGCAGENQNYRINEEQAPLFEESYPTEPGGEVGDLSEPAPSLTGGHDRSHWDRVVVVPSRGLVPHHPHYFDSYGYGGVWRVSKDRPSPLTREGDEIEAAATKVTAGARESFTLEDAGDFALDTAKPLIDIVAMPYLMIRDAPWNFQYSPRPVD